MKEPFTFEPGRVVESIQGRDKGHFFLVLEAAGDIVRMADGRHHRLENPKKKKFLGLVFMTTLRYNAEKNEYQNGTLKYPGKSGTFSTFMSIVDDKKLKVRGYWGFAALGKTMYWYRESKVREQKD